MQNYKRNYAARITVTLCLLVLFASMFSPTAAAAGNNVSAAIESTWTAAAQQIKTVVNNVVFPAIDLILAVLFFAKLATAYMDYRKHGQFEFAAPAILFFGLIFSLTAPLYLWTILGI
jgi:beta-lactamase regulating signal transducer with metallopeptidase domain